MSVDTLFQILQFRLLTLVTQNGGPHGHLVKFLAEILGSCYAFSHGGELADVFDCDSGNHAVALGLEALDVFDVLRLLLTEDLRHIAPVHVYFSFNLIELK